VKQGLKSFPSKLFKSFQAGENLTKKILKYTIILLILRELSHLISKDDLIKIFNKLRKLLRLKKNIDLYNF